MPENQERQIIQGEDIVVEVDNKSILHAAEHNLKLSPTFKEFRTKDTNGNEKSPGDVDWSVDVSGFVVIDPELAQSHTSDQIIDMILEKKRVAVTIKSKVEGALAKRTGFGYFSDFSLGVKAGENATYNGTITGSGNLSKPTAPEAQAANYQSNYGEDD